MDTKEDIYVNGELVGYRIVSPPVESTFPDQVSTMTLGAFIDRFSFEKHAMLLQLAKEDAVLAAAKHSLDIRSYIDVENPRTVAAVAYMVQLNLLTQEEADAILAPISATDIGAVLNVAK